MLNHPVSVAHPQIMSQANTTSNSLAKMKTIVEIKSSNQPHQVQQTLEMKNVQSMISNLQINGGQQRSANRFMERKTITCLSQDRNAGTSSANGSTRANASFASNIVPQQSSQQTYSSQLAQQFSQNQTRAQSSINTYNGSSNGIAQRSFATIDSKGRRLKKFEKLQQTFYETQLDPIDIPDAKDPQLCAEYAVEIFNFLRQSETDYIASAGYMEKQEDINEKMRGILIDWLVEVHLKFKLVPESLYLTVNLIDRFLEKDQVNRQKLQLVGVTAMLIACKYEEIYPPIVKDFVYITDNAYTKDEILAMERKML